MSLTSPPAASKSSVTKAIFPVAGLGTRFLPATKAQPKEMLTVVDKPLIQYAVEEAYAAGIKHMIFVTGRGKRSIDDHFDTAYELESELMAANKQELLSLVRSIKPDDMDCSYVRQERSLGLGHAILCAERMIGNEPFAVLLADDLMVNPVSLHPKEQAQVQTQGQTPSNLATLPILSQMIAMFEHFGRSILAVQEVPMEQVSRYGIVDSSVTADRLSRINTIVEKPSIDKAPSNLAVAGRYILTPAIFGHIRQQAAQQTKGEIQLTDGIASLLKMQQVYAYQYHGKRYDCGSKQGFLEATVELALAHPQVGANFHEFLKDLTATLD